MAGHERRRLLLEYIADTPDFEENLMADIACGMTLNAKVQGISAIVGVEIPRSMLMRWIDEDPPRRRAYDLAMKESAPALAEQGHDAIEAADPTPASGELRKAEALARFKQWLAGVRDRETFGDQKQGGGITINAQNLLLNALLAHGGPEAQLSAVDTPVAALPRAGSIADENQSQLQASTVDVMS